MGLQCTGREEQTEMGLETGAGVPDVCSVGLLKIFVLILRAGEANTGFKQRTSLTTLAFQRKIASLEVIFEVSKKRYQVGSRVCGTGPHRAFWAGNFNIVIHLHLVGWKIFSY